MSGRGEGQWALGYREPLNKNEEIKRNDDGLNVRRRILEVYSRYGFDSIDPADLRGRFRWYGLYTQRRPGIDGGKTAGVHVSSILRKLGVSGRVQAAAVAERAGLLSAGQA